MAIHLIMKAIVTGAGGQLGSCIRDVVKAYGREEDFVFLTSEELDITDFSTVEAAFEMYKPDVVINCAAYTDVVKAETDPLKAMLVNSNALVILVNMCSKHDASIIHVSTDFVFDGRSSVPYTELDNPNPLTQYGKSKYLGELSVLYYPKGMVVRTSWLYSEYGSKYKGDNDHRLNFFTKVMDSLKFYNEMNMLNDRFGSPTYARDLALALVSAAYQLESGDKYGLYHYSNSGSCSFYDFSATVESLVTVFSKYEPMRQDKGFYVELSATYNYIKPITLKEYSYDKIDRPKYSALDSTKFAATFNVPVRHWSRALIDCYRAYEKL